MTHRSEIEGQRHYILHALRSLDRVALADLKSGSGSGDHPYFGIAMNQLEQEGLVRCLVREGQTIVTRT